MEQCTFFPGADTPVLRTVTDILKDGGCQITDRPCRDITHLLLPVPSLDPQGYINNSKITLDALLQELPETVCVVGGNLDLFPSARYRTIDLLKDQDYLAQNAAITAHCAIKAALRHMAYTFQKLPVLVIGWGRIGKCLAALLRALDANVTVAARKETDRAVLRALAYQSCSIDQLCTNASQFDLIFNTVPHPVLDAASCRKNALLMEMASRPGITGTGIIDARGLPGKEAPLTSGALIGKTVLRLTQGKEHTP